jgi:hypothetical protein
MTVDENYIPPEVVVAFKESSGTFYQRIAIALSAWPGAYTKSEDWYSPPDTNLILPLPTEARDE